MGVAHLQKGRRVVALSSIRSAAENHAAPIRLQSDHVMHILASQPNVASQLNSRLIFVKLL